MKRLGLLMLLVSAGLLPMGCAKSGSPTSAQQTAVFSVFEGPGSGLNGTFEAGPSGIVIGPNAMYVADENFSAVDKYDLSGHYLGQYYYNYVTDLGGICVDKNGNVYASNYISETVDEFDANLKYLKSFTGSGTFSGPYDVKADASGFLYVTDYNNDAVYKVDQNDNVLLTSSGIPGGLDDPYETALAPNGHLYVADAGDSRVVGLDSNLVYTNQFDGSSGTAFSYPTGIAMDLNGNLIVVDDDNNNVQKFTTTGTFIQSYGNTANTVYYDDPYFVAVDKLNRIFVTDDGLDNVTIYNP